MIRGQDIEFALGLPILIEGFNDDKGRYAHAYKIKDLGRLNGLLSVIDCDDLFNNFKDETNFMKDALVCLLCETFKDEATDKDGIFKLVKTIDADNFCEIIKDIKKINGVSDDEQKNINTTSNDEGIKWDVSSAIVPLYSSNTSKDIQEMTFIQFTNLVRAIGKKINYEYKVATIEFVEDKENYITEKDHPMYSEPEQPKGKMITMKEIMSFAGQ